MDKVSYALGIGIGHQLANMGGQELNIDDFAQAVKDGYLVDFMSVETSLKFIQEGIVYDELSEEDKIIVHRARRLERFLSQNMFVAEKFTGTPGVFVPLEETIASFKAICDGEYDHLPEQAFLNVGNIEMAVEKAKKLQS